MKIKQEYYGKTITKSDSILGKIVVKVDDTCIDRYNYLVSMGFGFIFEKERIQPEEEEQVLRSEPENRWVVEEETEVKPKKKRKKK